MKSKHQFSEIYVDAEQFYTQLCKLFDNKKMRNGNKMWPNMRIYLSGYIWRNAHLSPNQRNSEIISHIYWQ